MILKDTKTIKDDLRSTGGRLNARLTYNGQKLTGWIFLKSKDLSAYEKLTQIQEVHFCRVERHNVAVYLNALRLNDREIIENYESFWESPRQLLMNKRKYEQLLLFGFTKNEFNEYGWFEKPKFLKREEIKFPHRDGWAVSNCITLGKGINRKWIYGMNYSYSTGGAANGLSVWGKIFDSIKDCLKAILNKMMTGRIKDRSKTDNYTV